jgi:hypothetical protein
LIVREFRTPKLVMLGWAGWVTTRAALALATLPTRFEELMLDKPDAFEAMSNPLIVREFRTPKLVMLGWAGWVTTRAALALATLPTRFEELMLDKPDALPV